ncbi:MAG: TolC family protein [Prevotella sp.]|jgi:outer membrane protein|nr:TolC family protein [Prevotella sp.]
MKKIKAIKVQGWVKVLPVYLFTLLPSGAQTQWSLRDCCEYAVANSITVKQKEKAVEKQGYSLSTARNSRLPNLSGTASQNFSFGRGLTEDNIYANTNTSNTSLQLQTAVPIFTGFQIPENIKLNRLNLEAATADLEKAKDDIRMEVAKAYVQILYDQEISAVAHRQVGIDSLQVVRLQAFVQNGRASEAELSRQKATMASSQLTATQADNNTRLAILTLTQLLELTTPEGFQIATPTEEEMLHIADLSLTLPDQVYNEALSVKPEIHAQELRLKGSEHSINIARAGHYPKLNFSAGLGTNYYTTSGFPSNSFGDQIKNNFSQFIGLNLTIPIFDRFSVRNNIRSAKVDRENQRLTLDNTKKKLYKEIQQVYYNALNAQAKENSSRQAVASSKDAFELTQAKYENGKANITEFNEAKNTYMKSESDLVQARYEHLYQRALLEFYRGKELNF